MSDRSRGVRAESPVDRRRALREPLGLAAAGLAVVAVGAWVAPRLGIAVSCPSLAIFGVYCPLCGGTRSVRALARGDLGGMVRHNALVPVLVVLAVWTWSAWTARRVGWRWIPAVPAPRVVAATLGVVALLYGILRNLPGEPWSWLAP